MMVLEEQESFAVPISALQHFSYCPRQFALIYLEQVFEDNEFTLRGQVVHQQVDRAGEEIGPNGNRLVRSLLVYHDQLGLVGKADLVEFLKDGTPYPIEYKHGSRRKHLHDDIQLAAQALCLEYMTGKDIKEGSIYHASSKKRRIVRIDAQLRKQVIDCLNALRKVHASRQLPQPVNDSRCRHCSLASVCEPDVFVSSSRVSAIRKALFLTE